MPPSPQGRTSVFSSSCDRGDQHNCGARVAQDAIRGRAPGATGRQNTATESEQTCCSEPQHAGRLSEFDDVLALGAGLSLRPTSA